MALSVMPCRGGGRSGEEEGVSYAWLHGREQARRGGDQCKNLVHEDAVVQHRKEQAQPHKQEAAKPPETVR